MGLRLLASLAAWVATAIASALLATFIVLVLAGPHGGLLPEGAAPWVLAAGWLTVIVVPLLVARAVWRRCDAETAQRGEHAGD